MDSSFYCSLSKKLLTDPVQDPEGNVYERQEIEKWIDEHGTNPTTHVPLSKAELYPNLMLKQRIEQERNNFNSLDSSSFNNENEISLSIVAANIKEEKDSIVEISIRPPAGQSRTYHDICCVVDVSGSMGEEASILNDKGDRESHGLTILDIVKHAIKTIISVLEPTDRLSLVSFSTNSKIIFELMEMNSAGKLKAEKEVNSLQSGGQTNLWAGLKSGIKILQNGHVKGKFSSIFLLTDGQPNFNPPRGVLSTLETYSKKNPLKCTINTFGFGYSLDSKLLNDLAFQGNGMYCFIPDAGFVGTIFVNALSNLLVTMAKNIQIFCEPINGSTILENGFIGIPSSKNNSTKLGSLQYGQTRSIVVKMKIPNDQPYLRVTLKFETNDSDELKEKIVEGNLWDRSLASDIKFNRHRLTSIETIKNSIEYFLNNQDMLAKKQINELITQISMCDIALDPRVQGLLGDLKGQVTDAFSRKDWFQRWGIHYLPSLINAHLLQICNNFKDPGVQIYGGKLFSEIRDQTDEIFIRLPPPEPSFSSRFQDMSIYDSSGSGSCLVLQDMSMYHSSGSFCIDGSCLVKMEDGRFKKVEDIRKGDKIMTPMNSSEVLCVVKSKCFFGMEDLVELPSKLLITPYHPVRISGKWQFPCQLSSVNKRPCDAVYNFVLKKDHIMFINGIECVSLGHNLKGEIVQHNYFGSQRILEDLRKMNGWNSGFVEISSGIIRDQSTGLVCGLKQEKRWLAAPM